MGAFGGPPGASAKCSAQTEMGEEKEVREAGFSEPVRRSHLAGQTVFVDAWHGADSEPSPGWRAYFHVDDVDSFAATIDWPAIDSPTDAVYGMREIVITDPDGNRLCFGTDIP